MKHLIFVLAMLGAPAFAEPRLEPLSSYTWNTDHPNHGGFSALHLSADGSSFITLTDRGDYVSGTIERSGMR